MCVFFQNNADSIRWDIFEIERNIKKEKYFRLQLNQTGCIPLSVAEQHPLSPRGKDGYRWPPEVKAVSPLSEKVNPSTGDHRKNSRNSEH